jgi:hypothetical protein
MKKYTVIHSVTAAPAAAKSKVKSSGSLLKIGLDIHREKFVVVDDMSSKAALGGPTFETDYEKISTQNIGGPCWEDTGND